MTICNNFFNLNTCCMVSVFKLFHYEWFWIFGTKRFYLNGLVFLSTPICQQSSNGTVLYLAKSCFFKLYISEPFPHKGMSNVY